MTVFQGESVELTVVEKNGVKITSNVALWACKSTRKSLPDSNNTGISNNKTAIINTTLM